MSAVREDVDVVEGRPACPVHPYGYHAQPRVRPAAEGSVFRGASALGLPARCARLEDELDAADRERDFIDELWRLEREPRPRVVSLLGAASTAALIVIAVLGDGGAAAAFAAVAAAGATVVADRGEAALHAARLARVRDWHRRVGVPR